MLSTIEITRYVHLVMYTACGWKAMFDSYWQSKHMSMLGLTPYYVPLLSAAVFLLQPIGEYIIFYGVPRSLTFGLTIGGVMPSTCETIRIWEGDNAFPCMMDAIMAW